MPDRIVVNTGPLIALARAEALDAIGRLPFRFVAPEEVRRELAAGTSAGLAPIDPAWMSWLSLDSPLNPVASAALDAGEAAVIQLALEQGVRTVCIDELKGRRAALAAGLQITGALGLLARAKRLGVVSALRPLVEAMTRSGIWYDPTLVAKVLAGVGE